MQELMLHGSRADLVAGVAGAGTMGRGIVQVLAQCGARTLVFDSQPEAAQRAKVSLAETLQKLAQRGKLEPAAVGATLGRIQVVERLEAFAPCQLVFEAIAEDLGAKRELLSRLEGVVGADCILASNTSSLSVTAMAAACKRPQRVAGYHFFNPVPVMKIVEVVAGELTEGWVTEALCALARRLGHTPVPCKDTPGFVVNHAGRAYVPEALRILSEGIADFATIDRILVEAAGFRLGPFGLMDLVGLDVSHAVMKSMYHQYFEEPKYRPSFLAEPRVAAGLLGRKTGRGWYTYAKDGTAEPLVDSPPPSGRKPESVWAVPELKELLGKLEARMVAKPDASSVCFVAPLGKDASTGALELGLDPRRSVAVDPLFGFSKRRTIMPTPATTEETRRSAHALLASDGVPVSVIKDSPGFVAQRVVAHIVNVGCDIAQMRIATPEDLDRAVVLGLSYPRGPLAMGDAAGPARVLAVLEAMHDFYQEPRYRPSPWLKRRAKLGASLLAPD
jgi:3-hydroxybutyryl-CoA dehydrogenase